MPITALIALRTVAVAALLAETAARAGTGAVSWCHPGGSRAQRAALALLLGWVTLGFLAFGLALGGVLTAHAVLAGTVALLAASGGLRLRPFLLVRVMRGAAGARPWWAAAGIAATVSLWPLLVAPESNTDCFIYHLGLPWHALRLHKLPPDAAPWLRVRVPVPAENPAVAAVTSVWLGANWFEREVWDMFGITFTGHPNLRRILMYEEFVGHPLRKDYPINKRQPIIGPNV